MKTIFIDDCQLDKKAIKKWRPHFQMDRDMKTGGLKALQGQIWFAGYQKGELVADFYDDVCPAMKKWSEKDIKIGIYSSGESIKLVLRVMKIRQTSISSLRTQIHVYDLTNCLSQTGGNIVHEYS